MSWTLARAKDQFSEVVRRAQSEGPQTISVRGKEAVVVLSKEEYDHLTPGGSKPRDFKQFLLSIPSLEGVDLTRDGGYARDIEI